MTRVTLLVPILVAVSAAGAGAQEEQESSDGSWRRRAGAASAMPSQAARAATAADGGDVYELDRRAFDARLAAAPHERRVRVEVSPAVVTLPLPDRTFARFAIVESPIMEAALAARFPGIRTYALAGVDRPDLRGRLDATPDGIHAIVLTGGGAALIDPLPDSDGVLYTSGTETGGPVVCGVDEARERHAAPEAGPAAGSRRPWTTADAAPNASGATRRTYRMAVATTGEYYRARGNTDLDVLASIVSVMNRVTLIFQTEVAVSFVIAADTPALFFTDPESDGYTNDAECVMRSENVAVVSGVLADDRYDLAHVFGSGIGGCAGGGNVCTASKANGASNLDTSPMRAFDHDGFSGYRLVAHELGHQLGAGHTWSGAGGNCTEEQFSPDDAYEPGGGTTLMSYSGTCDGSNIQTSPPDPYFHTHSFDEITEFLGAEGAMCGTVEVTGNSAPEVSAGPDYTIPRQTPFVLTGSASDAEGQGLTFTWEQHDLAPGQFPPGTDPGSGPLFRSVPPGPAPSRTFPWPGDLIANTTTPGELLPQTDRVADPLTFRLTARDGFASGGGVDHDTVEITVRGAPFRVTGPEGPAVLHAGCTVPVRWDVGGGGVASQVNVALSSDGGVSYSPLAAGVPNDGAQDVQLTCQTATRGRMKVEAADSIFFDASDSDFLVVNESPAVEAAAHGGSVDGSCRLTATFAATVTDDCGVDAGGVTVEASVQSGSADLAAPVFDTEQIDARTVGIKGSVLLSNVADGAATVQFAVGAADACGQAAAAVVTAEAADTTPPAIAVTLTPGILWPPNHKLVDITAAVTATDNCPGVRYVLTSVTSSEPDELRAGGSGATPGDIHGADVQMPDHAFQLRAERLGVGRGRTYTAVYTAIDAAGNETPAAAVVTVPGSRKTR